MTTAATHRASVGLGPLWFALLAGPVLWSLAELVGVPISAQSCFPGMFPLREPVIGSGVRWITGLWLLVSLAIQVAALVVAVRNWRTAREEESPDDQVGVRVRFMALSGIISSLLFLDALVLTALGIVLITPCFG